MENRGISFSKYGAPLSRRSILGGACVLSAMAFTEQASGVRLCATTNGFSFVVTDNRFSPSIDFGQRLSSGGSERLEVTKGLTKLWSERLAPHWRAPTGAVAGLTSWAVWEGLSEQSYGQFRRARIIGTHEFDLATNASSHDLTIESRTDAILADPQLRGAKWPLAIARHAVSCVNEPRDNDQTCRVGAPMLESRETLRLISWIIV